jgi:arginine/lysine/ornithine decarboxylase
MNTPIVDFVKNYTENTHTLRLHMPGHKGVGTLETYDITEIPGADSLYEANGIIAQSENNASTLFGARTFYSTEGSSLCIRAMLYLALVNHGRKMKISSDAPIIERAGKCQRPWILAGRNAHKTFLSAVALLDLDVEWLYPKEEESYLSCLVTAEEVESILSGKRAQGEDLPMAVYLTSPDYLGNRVDISAIAKVCHKYGVLLLVDNAHGAYLKFLPKSSHPMDLGADMCCDSAHKTLPALTGAAYLHIGMHMPKEYMEQAKNAMVLFGSTSPSYLILQSIDRVNKYLAEGYKEKLEDFIGQVNEVKTRLQQAGFQLIGNEPLKITIDAEAYGYTGYELAEELKKQDMVCEFADPDYMVLMVTPEIGEEGLPRLEQALRDIPKRITEGCGKRAPMFHSQERVLSIRAAMFSRSELLPVEECNGRILNAATVGCPPAVPIVICGEVIDQHAIECFQYYGIEKCSVVCE